MPDEPRLLKESSSLCRTNPYSSFSCGLTYATFILTLFENDALVPTFDVQRNWWWIEVILNFRIPYQRFYIFSRTQTDFLMCLKCVQTGRFKGSYKTSVWQIQPFNEIKTLHSSAFDNYTNIVKTATYISVVTILLDVRTRKQYDSWRSMTMLRALFTHKTSSTVVPERSRTQKHESFWQRRRIFSTQIFYFNGFVLRKWKTHYERNWQQMHCQPINCTKLHSYKKDEWVYLIYTNPDKS